VSSGAGNTLGLAGDGDKAAALEDVEAMFDLRLDPEAVSRMTTVGDLYDGLLSRIRARPGSCATSMAFYRLRRALQPKGVDGLAPAALLKPLVVGSPRKFRERLVAETGLEIPAMGATFLSLAGYTLFLAALLAGGLAIFRSDIPMGLYAAAGLALSVMLIRFDPQAVPAEF
jgi:hypothetical protein